MICDNCLTAAYDEGAVTITEQRDLCRTMGADIPDHVCEALEAGTTCGCACQYQYGPPALLAGGGLAHVD